MSQVHNAINRATELLRGYRRAMGLVDPESGVERFSETVTPIMDLWSLPEWAILRGEVRCWGYLQVGAGGAGVRSQIQLFNRVDTGRLMVMTSLVHGAAEAALGLTETQYTDSIATTKGRSETRAADLEVRGEIQGKTTGGAEGSFRHIIVDKFFDDPIVLAPGWGVTVMPTADNTSLTCNFSWIERGLLPGESAAEIR